MGPGAWRRHADDSHGDARACARKPAYAARRRCAGMQVMDWASAPTRGLVVEAQSRPVGAPHRADPEGPLRYHQVGMLPEATLDLHQGPFAAPTSRETG